MAQGSLKARRKACDACLAYATAQEALQGQG